MATVAPSLAATRWVSIILATTGTRLTSIRAVLKAIRVRLAAGVTKLANKNASVHVRYAATVRCADAHTGARHIDLAGNINRGITTCGELPQGVVDLTVLAKTDATVDEGRPTSGNVILERDGDAVATIGKRVGDL